MADMTEVQMNRLRALAEPHLNKSRHQFEMDELVLMALGRLATLEGEAESIDAADRNARRLEDTIDEKTRIIRVLKARVADLEQQAHERSGIYDVIALEGDRNALRDRVAELDAQTRNLRGSTILTRCSECNVENSRRLADMMDTADALRVATRPDRRGEGEAESGGNT